MSDHLLPSSATSAERALSLTLARIGQVPVRVRQMWNPDTCPADLLPWLAWALSVDEWDRHWTNAQKREAIKRAPVVHSYKGTIGAVRDALAALGVGVEIREWFNEDPPADPYTFDVDIIVEGEPVEFPGTFNAPLPLIEASKNLRSHLDNFRVINAVSGVVYLAAVVVDGEATIVYPGEMNAGLIEFDTLTASGSEADAGGITLLVKRTGGSFGTATIEYAVTGGSAVEGTDFSPLAGTLTWLHGDAAPKAVTIIPVDNDDVDGDKTVEVSLSDVTGAGFGVELIAVATIEDDDMEGPPPDGTWSVIAAINASFMEAMGSYGNVATDGVGTWMITSGLSVTDEPMYRSTDAGLTWAPISIGAGIGVDSTLTYGGGVFVVSPDAGGIWRSIDAGLTFAEADISGASGAGGGSGDLVYGAANTWLGASFASFYRSTDGGATWVDVTGPSAAIASVSALAYGDGRWIAVGAGAFAMPDTTGAIKSDDDGDTWTDIAGGLDTGDFASGLGDVASDGAGTWLLISSARGNHYRSTDGADSFSIIPLVSGMPNSSLSYQPGVAKFFGYNDTDLKLYSSPDGLTWTDETGLLDSWVNSVAAAADLVMALGYATDPDTFLIRSPAA